MISANSVIHNFQDPVDTITLDETARHRRRFKMHSDGGIGFLLDLPHARLLRHGDGLLLEDGRIVEVRAAPEKLYKVQANDPQHLLRLTWHMGNRHLPTQVLEDGILIRRDHVIKQMLEKLGGEISEIEAAFDPEGGAYEEHSHGGHHEE